MESKSTPGKFDEFTKLLGLLEFTPCYELRVTG